MDSVRFLLPNVHALDDARAELCACSVFSDERPFKGVAGLLDWRLGGTLSALAKQGFLSGRAGEAVMLPGRPRLPFDKLVLFGLGPRGEFGEDGYRAWVDRLARTLGGLHVRRAVIEVAARTVLAASRRAELLAEAGLGAEMLDRIVFVDDDEGQRALVAALKRSELRARTA